MTLAEYFYDLSAHIIYSEAKCAGLELAAAARAADALSGADAAALPLLVLRSFVEPDAYVQTLRYSCF